MNSNLHAIQALIHQVQQTLSAEEWEPMVVLGSSAIVLNGIELGRQVDDLDLFSSQEMFDALSCRLEVKTRPGKEGKPLLFLQPVPGLPVEIFCTFPGLNYKDTHAQAVNPAAAMGMKVCCLDDLITWKTAQGRPKDFADIEIIRRPKS